MAVSVGPLTVIVAEMEAYAGVSCFPVKRLTMDINASSWAHYGRL